VTTLGAQFARALGLNPESVHSIDIEITAENPDILNVTIGFVQHEIDGGLLAALESYRLVPAYPDIGPLVGEDERRDFRSVVDPLGPGGEMGPESDA
jgi:hypothetical protein